ncbi:hypothetical protein [Clostridioides sp. ZZV14-6150]|uniref:hypothetical protein n=1 Tax=unclassified Clostridioides TaxID=2635829 RepID=UPI001D126210|nr:hypothetical protein [Clostridioides sp. ZZV14-6150]MCC0660152.1 hypothetical protein [Clostridioides sp. ZZV14-6154]MCC0667340.1 hypothetical protein [Clostridioides sp. ZZV14-6153]MCC0721049.1 hypothetical protein [Clostridioides sp. ZZV14-6104]MCC0737225.1 hypothetical protein [Clostridioides sp. ZZV14-5902]WLD28842.1 hypothetical protein CDIFMA2_27290 [Clostridioides difficile]
MSRLERNIEGKSKQRKYKYIMRIIFLVIMIIGTSVCVFIVDSNAKSMLGIKQHNYFSSIKFDITKLDIPKLDIPNFDIHKIVEKFNK